MNYRIKGFGLALFAAVLVGAFSALPASALDFRSETSTDTVIKGSQVGTDAWTFNAGTVSCNEATYQGNQSGASSTTVSLTPSYSECKAFGFVNTAVDTNGCRYTFFADFLGIDIICPSEASLTVTAFNCWVTIGSQSTYNDTTYTNTGAGSSRDVDVTFNTSGLKYTQHSKSFPGCSGGYRSDGKYTAQSTFQGFTTGGTQTGFWRT